MINKKKELKTVCYKLFFYLRYLYLASYARVIGIGAINIALIRHFTSFMHSLQLFTLEHFSARKGFTSHANVTSVKHKSSFPS